MSIGALVEQNKQCIGFINMEFRVNQQTERDHREFIAVPSNDGGAFVIDHGEYYGQRVYRDLDLNVPTQEREKALAGDFSGSYSRVRLDPERPGIIIPTRLMLDVSIAIPGTRNTVSVVVNEVQELSPIVMQSDKDYTC